MPASIDALDRDVLHWAQQLVGTSSFFDAWLRLTGEWLVYAVPFLLVGAWFWYRKHRDVIDERTELVLFALSGVLGWQLYSRIIKLYYFRPRPSVAGENVQELFFHRPDEAFPSDHAALLFGFATYAYLRGWTKFGHGLLLVALIVASSRIITGTHWFTDIVGGIVVGMVSALTVALLDKPLRDRIVQPVVRIVTKWGL